MLSLDHKITHKGESRQGQQTFSQLGLCSASHLSHDPEPRVVGTLRPALVSPPPAQAFSQDVRPRLDYEESINILNSNKRFLSAVWESPNSNGVDTECLSVSRNNKVEGVELGQLFVKQVGGVERQG